MILAIALVLLSVLVLPYSFSDNIQFKYGYPFSFLTLFSNLLPMKSNEILLSKININPLIFLVDILIVHYLLKFLKEIYNRLKTRAIGKD
jgi:hypothetical protein